MTLTSQPTQPATTLLKTEEIFSRRHVPTWLMLTFASGCVNAIAFIACQRYVTHVTGTVTRIGMEFARLSILLDFLLVLFSFIAGAMLSAVLINGHAHRGKRPLHATPLIMVAAATASVGLIGDAGLLGPFGGTVDQPVDFVILSILSFASGLQNAAVATSTGLLVRTTHLTGPATDLGIHLVGLAYLRGEARDASKRHALLRAGKLVSFGVGAGAGLALSHSVGFLGFLVPAILVLLATTLSFLPDIQSRIRERRSLRPLSHPAK